MKGLTGINIDKLLKKKKTQNIILNIFNHQYNLDVKVLDYRNRIIINRFKKFCFILIDS